MSQRPPCVSRADLLRLMDEAGEIDDRAAAACGYMQGDVEKVVLSNASTTAGDAHTARVAEDHDILKNVSSKPAPWPFLRVKGFERKGSTLTERVDSKHPLLSNADLRVRNANPDTRTPPLVPWPRLVTFLRSVLGRSVKTSRIHDRKLGRMLARGNPLTNLPKLPRRAWVPQAVILWDTDWREMSPFREDFPALRIALEREMGKSCIKIIQVNGPPTLRQLAGLTPEVPVFAISTLGQYQGEPRTLAAWAAVARNLTHRGHPLAALSPCPRRYWREEISTVWPFAAWDGRPRLCRRNRTQHFGSDPEPISQATETLLALLSPAARVERPLLRSARQQLGSLTDVGCEWEAWFHPLGWHSSDSFGLIDTAIPRSSEVQAQRLQARSNHPLACVMDSLIQQQHQHHAPLVELEAKLRSAFSRHSDASEMQEVVIMLQRVVERLHQMDPDAGNPHDQRSNIAPWFVDMVSEIPPQFREDSALAELVAEGLGLAHRFLQTEQIDWAEGVQVEIALRVLQSQITPPDQARKFRLTMKSPAFSEHGGKELQLSQVSTEQQPKEFPAGVIAVSRPYLHISAGRSKKGASHSFLLSGAEHPLGGLARSTGEFRLESDVEKLMCERFTRPTWAKRMWYDKYGLAAEFQVKNIPFVMRWIPPGRFLMGSPAHEPGRYEDEGPRHERVIKEGFWLGETVVTQAQWRAVMIGENPSYFKGPESLPVEQVSWDYCDEYCSRLSALVPGLEFRLPKEQEWEYACRAGTETSLWTGGITIRKAYDSPELEDIAWYAGNSWKEPVVENLYDMMPHDWRHPKGDEAGIHAVKGKEANPWGLYDMLGNVWEWCADVYEAYENFGRGEELPKGAGRVVRGSSWCDGAGGCRAAYRFTCEPGYRSDALGFRLAAGQELEAAEPHGSGSDPDG